MDKAVDSYNISQDQLGNDYSTIFKTSLEKLDLVSSRRIPGSRFSYVIESQEPLILQNPADFPAIDLNRGNHWPYGDYLWITRCLYKPSGLGESVTAKGEVFIYCDNQLKHALVLGYYKEDDRYFPVFPNAVGVKTPVALLRTGRYEKVMEFEVPVPANSKDVMRFYSQHFQRFGWKLQPAQSDRMISFMLGKRRAEVCIEPDNSRLNVRVAISSLAE